MSFQLNNLPHLQIGNIYCIGRNYADHALELNNPIPDRPIIFSKPTSSLLSDGGTVIIPSGSVEVHHEAELVIAIGKSGKNITVGNALSHIAGISIGIDITDRHMQSQLKKDGLPWLLAKGLDTFGPLGSFYTDVDEMDYTNIDVVLSVNGIERQNGNTKLMLFPVSDLIVRLSAFFTLQPGDLIFTGTPAGVGPMKPGDLATATIRTDEHVLSHISVDVQG
jgi:2-keto-4-pentenoate hydratase/2-oxohepta-3-ene-1,7-dioic acid hydratase in catechol pathway